MIRFLSKGSVPSRLAIMNFFFSEIRGRPLNASSPSERVFSMALPRKAPLSTPGTPVLEDFPQNDDEKERLQRRRSRVLDLQFSADSPHLLASPSGSRCVPSALPTWGGRLHWVTWAQHLYNASWVWGLEFEKLEYHGSLTEFFGFGFLLGILTFQPRFLSLQTHRLQNIIPPVSNCPLKM